MNNKMNYAGKMAIIANQYKKEKEYWLQKMSGTLVKSYFPYDFFISGQHDQDNGKGFETLGLEFSPAFFSRLIEINKGSDYALYIILVSGLVSLLYKYTENKDIIVGAPIFKQAKEGKFINTVLAVRSRIETAMTFKQLLTQVKESVLEADANMNFPIEILLNQLDIPYTGNDDFPLFDTMILLENIQEKNYISDINVNLKFYFRLTEKNIHGTVAYKPGRYRKETVQTVITHYINLLEQALSNPHQPLSALDILDPQERKRILYTFNNTAAGYPQDKTLHRLIAEQVERKPDQIAVVDRVKGKEDHRQSDTTDAVKTSPIQITYRELKEKSIPLEYSLRKKGVEPDTIVGIMVERSIEMLTGILAILNAGGAYLPIDTDYPPARIEYMLADSGVKILLCKLNKLSKLIPLNESIETIEIPGGNEDLPTQPTESTPPTQPYHLAYVIYTSGSTGRPKGMLIRHNNVVRLMVNDKNLFAFSSSDVWTLFHSYCFDFSVWEIFGALLYGGKLVIIKKMTAKDPGRFLKILKQEKVTVLNQTPQAFYNLIDAELKYETEELNLDYVIFGGEALKPVKLKSWRQKYPGVKLINMYGITETTVHVTYKEIREREIDLNISNIGSPIPTTTTYVLDQGLNLLPIGVSGELFVGGDGVGRGYLNRPELTYEKFLPNPYKPWEILYRTGDQVKLSPDGEMEYLGRIDHQVKIRGYRIEVEEIESHLLKHKDIKEAAILSRENKDGSKYLCAYVTAVNNNKETGEGLANNLREFLLQKLPDYMIPSYFIRLDQFPLTVNGKLDRKALPEPNVDIETEYKAPTNEIQEKMAEAWQQVLGHEKIGISSNFFQAGGDSINAITVISKLNDSLHADLVVADLYIYQTIEELSEQLVKNRIHYPDHDEFLEEAREDIQEFKKRFIEHNKMTDEIEDVYPMSDIEKGMVYHYLNDPQGAFYFEQNAYKVTYKDFNIETFKQALTLMVKKHPILRTGFDVDDFAHVIYKSVSPVVSDYDISSMTEQEQRTYVLNYMERSRKVMFQRLTPPLWRMVSFKPGNEYVIILMELHHAMLDGWSLSLFLTELERIYLQLKSQKQVNLGKVKCSYKEFITSETAVKKRIAAREYWKNELSGYKRFTLPPTGQEGNDYKKIEIKNSRERLEQLQMTAAKHNTSLKHLCFAAYVYALGMFSYENDIVLGLITNNRPIYEDGDRLLGCFLNTIPVRIQIPTRIKWHEYIKQIDEKLIEIKKYDMMPFNEIVKIIEEKPGDQNPIFDCTFNYIDFYAYQGIQSENVLEDISVGSYIKTNTFLGLDIDVSLKTLRIFWEYSTGFISETYCKKLCTYFQEVLNKFIDEPEGYAIKSAIIPEREKHKILFALNNTGAEYPEEKAIHGLFEEQAKRTPDHMTLVGKGESWQGRRVESNKENISITYRELHQKSGQLAHLLVEKGIVADTIVGIMSQRTVEMIIGILGILKAGGAYLPIDPAYPKERIDFMLKDSEAKILLTPNFEPSMKTIKSEGISVNSLLSSPSSSTSNRIYPANLAYVIYTSGTTGKPKGVLVEHRNVVNVIYWFVHFHKVEIGTRILQLSDFTFDASVDQVFGALTSGAGLYIAEIEIRVDIEKLRNYITNNKINIINFVPTYLKELLCYADKLQSLHTVISGAENLDEITKETIISKGYRLVNQYGPTEATIDVLALECSAHRVSLGKSISNVKVYILDKYENLLPIGVVGELYIAGAGVARGYLNHPGLTGEKFTRIVSSHSSFVIGSSSKTNDRSSKPITNDQCPMTNVRLYRTGDLARWLPDGNIEFLGRLDFQVKIRGNRIELGEIEKQLLNYQNIKEAVVTARKDQKGNGYLCAYIIPTSIDSAEPLDARNMFKLPVLREYLARRLPDYMIPAHFVVLPGLPLTASSKLDRNRLPEPEGIDLEPDTKYIAPRDEIEKNLVDIWQQVLGKNIIGIHDNFFELGGDSIKAIQIASRMHKAGYKIEIRDIFQQRRISDLVALVKKIERIADQSIITGTISLTPIQKWFFNNHPIDTHHFNQAMMLYIEPGEEFPDQLVRTVFPKLQEHHDALRMSYKEIDGKIIQTNHGLEYPLSLAEYDFRGCGSAVRMLEQKADELQASIDLEKGPLMKLGLFHLDDGYRLLMVIHHLVIDGVSWRILFEDLETLYMQYRRGEELSLPLKTDSFKTWSEKLHEYANDQSFLKEKLYWQNLAAHDLPVIKKDFPVETDYLKDKNALSFTLNEEETSLLLTKANVAFGTEISDLLLTALGLGLQETFAIQRILIALEGHGREEIIKDVDITRTVGWFTSLYPVLLDFSYENDLSRQIKDIKENLHRVPNKGIGYGILKYLTVEEVTGDIDLTLNPQICFNYLGQFDTDINQFSSFQPAKESPGNPRSLKGKQEYLFVVTGIIVNNFLELTIEYNKNHFKLETIEKLIHCCQVNLKQVITFCLDRETSELTPSDLDYQEFSIDELGNLFE
jgi:amino acid adenylation domain-containing protein/non-ribosomal peptide synthase protein (TIGR01720 family)